MGSLKILLSSFSLLISAAEIRRSVPGMNIMRIIPEDASVPDYTPLDQVVKDVKKPANPSKYPKLPAGSYLNFLPSDLLTLSFRYLSFKDLGNVSQTSIYFRDSVEKSLKHLTTEYGDFDLSALTRKDQVIVILHLLPILKISYPGLFKRQMTTADLICLSLLTFIASSGLKVVEKQLIMPSSQEFTNLFNTFLAMNYISNLNNNIYNPVPTMLKSCGVFTAFLKLVINSEQQIPYTLEAINFLAKFPSVNNSQFHVKSIVLYGLGLDMSVKDQRFIKNLLKNMPENILVSAKIGQRHVLHEFIIKGFEFDEEIFSKPGLVEVQVDRETRSHFYEAALIYSIKYKNWSCLKGLLGFSNASFPSFSIIKLDLLRQAKNYDEILSNFNTIPMISEFLIN